MKHILKRILRRTLRITRRIRNKGTAWSESDKQAILRAAKGTVLTGSEKKAIKELWGQIDEPYFKAIKSLVPFDARYCSNDIYLSTIIPVLNPHGIDHDKNLFDSLYADEELRFPETYVKNIQGIFFDDSMQIITAKQAVAKILSVLEFVIKPSADSSGGNNVRKICHADEEVVLSLFREYHQNFIVQKVVQQHSLLAEFNDSSTNTMRITTLFLNGKISVCARLLKIGKKGSFVDNAASGGTLIGLDEQGNLKKTAFTKYLDKAEVTKEMNFPFYPDLEKLAVSKHVKYFPNIGIVGWDISADSNGKPVCIEVNLSCPEIFSFQFCCGPAFGERTKEVIDFVKSTKIDDLKLIF